MQVLTQENNYSSPARKLSLLAKLRPGWTFYPRLFSIILFASHSPKRGKYLNEQWVKSSLDIFKALEASGIQFTITNMDTFKNLNTPCVFVANHMSTLETFILPCLIQPFKEVTFIVKEGLVNTPIFKHVMISRDPIVVGRVNPREDLKTVLEDGYQKLKNKRSIIVFPQTTRRKQFDPKKFNTIGIKLAKNSDVPVIPVALKTDSWGTGKAIKDFGEIDPSKKVHFAFGEPIHIKGNGKNEHQQIIQFIRQKLNKWSNKVSS